MKNLLPILIFIAACSKPVPDLNSYYEPNTVLQSKIDQEIAVISNAGKLQEYLENIKQVDQQYRKEEVDILDQYGHGSDEHKVIMEKINQVDAENYFRIEAVFKTFGYPNIDSVGEEAAMAPWIVIHHSPIYEHRIKHFQMIYGGYLNGHLSEDAMELYLDRTYKMKFNKMFKMPSPYRVNSKIDTLVKVLNVKVEVVG